MATFDPQAIAAKWAMRAGSASQEYLRGVETTDKDPTALAAAAGQRYINGVQEAYSSGKWARRLQAVGKAGWIAAVQSKGATNYASGVQASEQKYAAAMGPVLAAVSAGQRIVSAMPNITPAQRDARMLAFVQHMRQYGASR